MLTKSQQSDLYGILTRPIESFSDFATNVATTADGPLFHVDRGADVLCVAHLDYVKWTDAPKFRKRGKRVHAGQLDDRLGAWIALCLLPELGVNVDVLLTDSEEIGRSTARSFYQEDVDKSYNWICQFDRHGTDVVMYDYETDAYADMLREYGFRVGSGSFSDICYLQELGVAGFNIGTGYHHEHTDRCYANLRETITNVKRFQRMHAELHATRLEDNAERKVSKWDYVDDSYGWGLPDDTEYDIPSYPLDVTFCADCGEEIRYLDWECMYCGAERSDCSALEFIARMEREDEKERFNL